MTWEIYRESVQALSDVEIKLAQARQRVEVRHAADLHRLRDEQEQAEAALVADRARLDALREELRRNGSSAEVAPVPQPGPPASIAEWRRRLYRLEQGVSEAVVTRTSLERSLRRLKAQPPAAARPIVQAAPHVPTRRRSGAVLVLLVCAVVLVVGVGLVLLKGA